MFMSSLRLHAARDDVFGHLVTVLQRQGGPNPVCYEPSRMSMATDMKGIAEEPVLGVSPKVSLRLYPDLDRAIMTWMKRQPGGKLSRPEAIRQLLVEALARK